MNKLHNCRTLLTAIATGVLIVFFGGCPLNNAGGFNKAPVAEAGPNRVFNIFDRVDLDAGGSSDPDGDSLTYRWSFYSVPQTSTARIDDPNTKTPHFSWSAFANGSYYHFQLNDSADFSGSLPVYKNDLLNPEYQTTTSLNIHHKYYWRVRNRNTDGVRCDWTVVSIFTTSGKKWEVSLDNAFPGTAAVGPQGVIYIMTGEKLYAFENTGTKKWEFVLGSGGLAGELLILQSGDIICTSSMLRALNENGVQQWSLPISGGSLSL